MLVMMQRLKEGKSRRHRSNTYNLLKKTQPTVTAKPCQPSVIYHISPLFVQSVIS